MNKMNLLIVEDDLINQSILNMTLEDDYSIKMANSGEDALELLKNYSPDIILLDVQMPGIDGYSVCEKIRKDKMHKFVKIIFLSGLSDKEERLKGYKVGGDDYVTKPFDEDELLAKLKVYGKLKTTEELDSTKSNFLSLISHETRTPLNGIIGFVDIVKEEYADDENLMELLEIVSISGDRLLDLVNKTTKLCDLKLSLELNKSKNSIPQMLKNIVESFQEKLDNKNIEIILNINSETELFYDWHLIVDAFENIIDNAIKFSNENSKVEININKVNGSLQCDFIDYGIGIKEENNNKIFEEFAIQNLLNHQEGLGISLAITKHIIELHNGTINASSINGKTTFTILLPIT